MTHLWEVDHPYYATHGNFYVAPADQEREGIHRDYDSWAAFYEARGGSDPDCALVYRWDWHPAPDGQPDTLDVFWIMQGNAICQSSTVAVTRDDEPAVRAWLADRARTIAAIWAPILVDGDAPAARPSVRGGARLHPSDEDSYREEQGT